MAPVAGYLPGGRGAGSGGGGGIGRPYMPPSSASVSSHASSGQRPCASSSSPTNPRVACSSTPLAALRNSNHPSAQPGHVSCRTFSLPEPILPADDALRSLLDDALLPSADQLYGSPDPMGSYSGEGTPFSRSYSETDASRAQARSPLPACCLTCTTFGRCGLARVEEHRGTPPDERPPTDDTCWSTARVKAGVEADLTRRVRPLKVCTSRFPRGCSPQRGAAAIP